MKFDQVLSLHLLIKFLQQLEANHELSLIRDCETERKSLRKLKEEKETEVDYHSTIMLPLMTLEVMILMKIHVQIHSNAHQVNLLEVENQELNQTSRPEEEIFSIQALAKLIGSEEGLLSNKEIVRKLEKERLKTTTIKDENLLKKLLP